MMTSVKQLRAQAISHSLFPETTLKAAIGRLGFVQADPIRSPARAQDLILRQRVRGYRAGGLDRRYPRLGLEEDVLYAYGFMPRSVWQLLHPRKIGRLSKMEQDVLDVVRESGVMHPREMEGHFGRKQITNAWGGQSKATTQALEALRAAGRLRVARRKNGIRLYEEASPLETLPPTERLEKLVVVIANLLAPVPERSLHAITSRYRHLGNPRATVRSLVESGCLRQETVDGVRYIWPSGSTSREDAPRRVRFLAPFDPLVWDRQRFGHLWGWPYRFEAYTPAARRQRGYYAMPLLWRDAVVGWANAGVRNEQLSVEVGFIDARPRDRDFRSELDAEIDRLRSFLGLV